MGGELSNVAFTAVSLNLITLSLEMMAWNHDVIWNREILYSVRACGWVGPLSLAKEQSSARPGT